MIHVGVAVAQEINFAQYVLRAGIDTCPARLALVGVQPNVSGVVMAREWPMRLHRGTLSPERHLSRHVYSMQANCEELMSRVWRSLVSHIPGLFGARFA